MEEPLAILVQPDALLSDQYWEAYTRTADLPPEKELMLALLEDTISCFQKHLLVRDAKFREAEEWILEENDDGLFSFESVCDALRLDPGCVRQALLRWKDKQMAEAEMAPRRVVVRVRGSCSENEHEKRARARIRTKKSSRRTGT